MSSHVDQGGTLSEKTGHRAISEALIDSPSAAKQTPDQERLRLYEFGPFRLDPTERTLLRGNEVVPLTAKAFDTLYLLVRNSGHVLEKDEMIRALWPDTFVEEGSLSNNIFLLRKALGENPSFIETVPAARLPIRRRRAPATAYCAIAPRRTVWRSPRVDEATVSGLRSSVGDRRDTWWGDDEQKAGGWAKQGANEMAAARYRSSRSTPRRRYLVPATSASHTNPGRRSN